MKLFKKIVSALMSLALLLSCVPTGIFANDGIVPQVEILEGTKKADPSTINWEQYFGPDKLDTEFAGGVWTDKSVFTGPTAELPGITLNDERNFLVSLSSIASNLAITGHTSAPTDTMLVLDLSGSMVDDTYEVGIVRQGNRYQTANGIDMSLINAMVQATNSAIDKLMKQNTNNRVGVVLYSGNAATDQAATPSTATVVLPLGRYSGVSGEYLSVDTTWTTATLYTYRYNRWQTSGTATYVPSGTQVHVSVRDGLRTEAGATVADASKYANGGTYLQNGLYKAMNEFLAVTDTTVPEGRAQAGAERVPVVVLMTDGAPTIATTSYASIGNSNTGDGTTTDDRITFLTQLTAAYVRGRVAAHYQENAQDDADILFLTLGLGTENSTAATNTLYPAGSNANLVSYWNTYLAAAAGQNVAAIPGNGGLTVRREADVKAMNYVDTYYYASDAQSLIDSFQQIVTEISLKAESYATLVEGGNADLSGYVTFEDELGEMMYVAHMKGVLMSDGNGGTVLYTGKGIAQGMTNGNLGTVDNPTERGDELVRTVKERIPGTTTTQAQQLIANAYADGQLYYTDDNNWSNYIGWYADASGNYVGFWDKDSDYRDPPANAVYINQSYGYLGVNGDSDMMHVVVMVRTELATQHQTVFFKIPAALLPTVEYKVTLGEDDPDKVESFVREDAVPMQLVFEVGLRPDINAVNLEQKIAEHLAKGGHVHRNADGTVTFYTNEWAIGNDKNGNGIPDADEVQSAMVAESHFQPAMDNSRYFFTENTMVLDAAGNPVTGAARPTGTCYHHRYIYSPSGRTTKLQPISAENLSQKAQYDAAADRWFIPAGTIFSEVTRFRVDKTENTTGTLPYADYPAVFANGAKQDVYAFLGNNGSMTVAPAQGIALTKRVSEVSADPAAPSLFTFHVTLSQPVAAPSITDTQGNPLAGIAAVSGNVISLTIPADQTVVISGIPTGTAYTVTEETSRYYKAYSANATGTVNAYTVHAVDFVNTAKGVGSLVVGKDVNYPASLVPGEAHGSKVFTVQVTFSGDLENMVAPQGAQQEGNTFTLQLKDGQSATFTNIPEGVSYTVSEATPPAGFAFQELRYSDATQTIQGKDLDEAHVINRYSVAPVSPNAILRGSKTLVTNDSSWNGASFTVELLRLQHVSDEEPVSTGLTAVVTEAAPTYEIDLSSLSFQEAGTYYFRVVEQIPADRDENIAYDRTFGLFSIQVGDADADGALEIQDVHGYRDTLLSGSSEAGWVLEKNFTNVVTTDRIYLNVLKHVTDVAGTPLEVHRGDMAFGLFTALEAAEPAYYGLTNTAGQATLMIPVTKEAIAAAGGKLTYYLREVAPQHADRVTGMHYDESWRYAVSIGWNEEENKAAVEYAPMENGQVGAFVPYDGSFVFEHTNIYEPNVSVQLSLQGTKLLNGGTDLGGRAFTFELFASTAAFVTGDRLQAVQNSGNSFQFSGISFTAPGVYYLVAKEAASNLGGITVDPTEYHITVAVEKYSDAAGVARLRLVEGYPTVIRYGTSENVGASGLAFNNGYTVTGSGEVTFGGTKILTGRPLVAEEFTIGLYSDAACTQLIEAVTNKADGTFAFSALTFTVDHLGADLAAATYTYYVKEIPGSLGGVSYDSTVHTVTVTVSHRDGQLVVTPSGNAATLSVRNSYVPKSVTAVIRGSKVLSGNWDAVTDKQFRFQLFQADESFAVLNQTPLTVATANGSEGFSIGLTYADGQEGTWHYVLKEDTSAQAGGVGYDAGEYHITVTVSDPGDGQLVAFTNVYRPGTGYVDTAVFTNTYTVEPTSLTLEGTKQYVNGATGAQLPMAENMFTFLVLEGEHLAATGYNLADGTIVFTPIRYTQAGVHTYTVKEAPGEQGIIRYDEAEFTVTVTVTDNGDGTLTAAADYGADPVAFVNAYVPQAAQVTLGGTKVLAGDWSAVPAASKEFHFALYATDATFAVSGDPVDQIVAGPGAFRFGTRTFTEAGTYYFVAMEQPGPSGKGIVYDSARIRITVTVTDNGAGKLIPAVTVSQTSASVDLAENIATVEGLTFTNRYEPKPAAYIPEAQKLYIGDAMQAFDFVLTVDGNPQQTKQNDAAGKVVFDPLTFAAPGIYTVTVREQENALFGLIRWDVNVYTVTLHVEDDGQGQLFVNQDKTTVTSEKGTDDLVFRNVHHSVITQKDVFLPAEPTVSIDGKAVEVGDELLYKVTYNNYDTVPVTVTVTDVIPQYTAYVEGSADHDGIYGEGKLTWNVALEAGQSVTVSFRVKVTGGVGQTVSNQASTLEGGNTVLTNTVTNPVKEDTVEKDVFMPAEPTVSIDGQAVERNDILLYKVTYTNSDDFAAQVTITDVIPEHTAYVEGSADHNGVFESGKLTWNVTLEAGASITVSFRVKVTGSKITVTNQAAALEGENTLHTNVVRNPVEEDLVTKAVYAAAAPTVSIDGKAVEVGDVLIYAITYTNFDGQAAQVTITDVIPEHTAYVEGSADHNGVFESGKLTWNVTLEAGASITVSFRVKVTGGVGQTLSNQATALEGENTLHTNAVTNPVKEDTVEKDVFQASAPTVSIDGETVHKGDVLLYAITYTNADDFAADVTVTDAIPQYTAYVEGSADHDGVYGEGKLTWQLHLEAGESVTVTFKVKVTGTECNILNQAEALEGENTLHTNVVRNKVPASQTPDTGDDFSMVLWFSLMLTSALGLTVMLLSRKRVIR